MTWTSRTGSVDNWDTRLFLAKARWQEQLESVEYASLKDLAYCLPVTPFGAWRGCSRDLRLVRKWTPTDLATHQPQAFQTWRRLEGCAWECCAWTSPKTDQYSGGT